MVKSFRRTGSATAARGFSRQPVKKFFVRENAQRRRAAPGVHLRDGSGIEFGQNTRWATLFDLRQDRGAALEVSAFLKSTKAAAIRRCAPTPRA
jgi:hypothetical protein